MSFKIPNIAVKCSRSFFLIASVQPLLQRTKASMMIFLASAKIISMRNIKYYAL